MEAALRLPEFTLLALLAGSCAPPSHMPMPADGPHDLQPPTAAVNPRQLEAHGHVRTDNYYWLRERENPAVIDYLEAENRYTAGMMAHTEALQNTLFEEIKGRIKQDDATVPTLENGSYTYIRFEDGRDYPIYCRRRGSMDAPEEVMLDVNQLADGHGFYAVRGVKIAEGGRTLAFAADTVGRRIYTLHLKDLDTGELLSQSIPAVTGLHAWANDDQTLFYVRQDPSTLRWYRIYSHRLGTSPDDANWSTRRTMRPSPATSSRPAPSATS